MENKKASFLISVFFLEKEVMCLAKSLEQVMHILEFVRKQENFTMEQKITYKKNKPLTKQCHKASILSLLFVSCIGGVEEQKGRREYMWLSHIIIRLNNHVCLMTITLVNS